MGIRGHGQSYRAKMMPCVSPITGSKTVVIRGSFEGVNKYTDYRISDIKTAGSGPGRSACDDELPSANHVLVPGRCLADSSQTLWSAYRDRAHLALPTAAARAEGC